jgi:plastocyanin
MGTTHPATHAVTTAPATHAATTSASTTKTQPPTHSATPTPTHSKTASATPTHVATACAGTPNVITIQEQAPDSFVPSAVTINRCDAVKAVNSDASGTHHTWQGPGWNSGDQAPGTSYTYRFPTAGSFHFICAYHDGAGMNGNITVK